jgi:hypothetical protein
MAVPSTFRKMEVVAVQHLRKKARIASTPDGMEI